MKKIILGLCVLSFTFSLGARNLNKESAITGVSGTFSGGISAAQITATNKFTQTGTGVNNFAGTVSASSFVANSTITCDSFSADYYIVSSNGSASGTMNYITSIIQNGFTRPNMDQAFLITAHASTNTGAFVGYHSMKSGIIQMYSANDGGISERIEFTPLASTVWGVGLVLQCRQTTNNGVTIFDAGDYINTYGITMNLVVTIGNGTASNVANHKFKLQRIGW